MLWPKVVGQSGTASAAPVLFTSPPNRISTKVAPVVTRARRCASLLTRATASMGLRPTARRSVPGRGRPSERLRLRKKVLLRLRRAVLVGAAVDRRQRRTPVQVGWRRRRRPLQRVGVPRVERRLLAGEQAP